MKPLYFFSLIYLIGKEACAQYPYTNYWFIETGGAISLGSHKQPIYKNTGINPIPWSPNHRFLFNLGGHLESLAGRFIEIYAHVRYTGQNIDEPKVGMGLKIGAGKDRWRCFVELNHGSRNAGGGTSPRDDAVGIAYGLGWRYRLITNLSVQSSFLRNHFSQYYRADLPYKHPVRSFASLSLHWNLNTNSDKWKKSPKAKKLTPRRQNRCLYTPAV